MLTVFLNQVIGYGNINSEKIREVPRILDFEVDTQKSQYQFYASIKPSNDEFDLNFAPDLGSGIFLRDNRYWRIIGMVESKSEESDRNFKPDSSGYIFTNLEVHKDWIERTAEIPQSPDNDE